MKSISELVNERPLYSVTPDLTVAEVAKYMAEKNIGAIPIVEENRLVGIFSERDMITRVIAKGLEPSQTRTREVMTTRIVVATAEETYESCLKKMQQLHCRHLPIVSGEQLIGMVSLRDLLMIDIDKKEQDLEYLHSYIYTIPPGMAKRY
ncbi:MAG: CBS domain-containing protein [Ignavibacteriales bacterium]|nr:CBS domain-containing protein [Ignavibacteriales bacterium]